MKLTIHLTGSNVAVNTQLCGFDSRFTYDFIFVFDRFVSDLLLRVCSLNKFCLSTLQQIYIMKTISAWSLEFKIEHFLQNSTLLKIFRVLCLDTTLTPPHCLFFANDLCINGKLFVCLLFLSLSHYLHCLYY